MSHLRIDYRVMKSVSQELDRKLGNHRAPQKRVLRIDLRPQSGMCPLCENLTILTKQSTHQRSQRYIHAWATDSTGQTTWVLLYLSPATLASPGRIVF